MPPRRSTSRARTSSTKSGAKKASDESRSRSRSRTRASSTSRKTSVKSGVKKTPKQVLDVETDDAKPVSRSRPVTRSTSRSRRERSASPSPSPQPLAIRTRSRSAGRNSSSAVTPAVATANVFVIDEDAKDNTLTHRNVIAATQPLSTSAPAAKTEKVKPARGQPTEFGGPLGNLGLMVFSHFIVLYVFLCLNYNNGSLILPSALTVDAFKQWGQYMIDTVYKYAYPTPYAFAIYWVFQTLQILKAVVLPGVIMYGSPIPSEGNRRLKYTCNALSSWYVTLTMVFILHWYDIFPITEIIDNVGPITTVSMISADVIAVLVYLSGFVLGIAAEDRTGNVIYDFFMGSVLNPRLGSFDIKMFAEVRVSWIMLFLISVSAAVKQFQVYGFVTYNMCFMLLAQFLYTNAIMKGEDCIPPTWDIFHEKWGWMLAFWNLSGVPFVYCAQSIYAFHHTLDEQLPLVYYIVLTAVYLFSYYVFDTANSQKNRFRMILNGTNVDRPWAFPQFKFGTLRNPEYLVTKAGTPLLVDGWYKYARKLHYTVDVVQGLCWGLSCGFQNFLPYFYVCFFTIMIVDRIARDERRMTNKYGEDWERYVTKVPYRFIPGIY